MFSKVIESLGLSHVIAFSGGPMRCKPAMIDSISSSELEASSSSPVRMEEALGIGDFPFEKGVRAMEFLLKRMEPLMTMPSPLLCPQSGIGLMEDNAEGSPSMEALFVHMLVAEDEHLSPPNGSREYVDRA